jgi:hypothetical protein
MDSIVDWEMGSETKVERKGILEMWEGWKTFRWSRYRRHPIALPDRQQRNYHPHLDPRQKHNDPHRIDYKNEVPWDPHH